MNEAPWGPPLQVVTERMYNAAEVDSHIDALRSSIAELQERLATAEARAEDSQSRAAEIEALLGRALMLAQKAADRAIAKAYEERARLLQEAAAESDARRRDASRLLQEAVAQASDTLRRARHKADAVGTFRPDTERNPPGESAVGDPAASSSRESAESRALSSWTLAEFDAGHSAWPAPEIALAAPVVLDSLVPASDLTGPEPSRVAGCADTASAVPTGVTLLGRLGLRTRRTPFGSDERLFRDPILRWQGDHNDDEFFALLRGGLEDEPPLGPLPCATTTGLLGTNCLPEQALLVPERRGGPDDNLVEPSPPIESIRAERASVPINLGLDTLLPAVDQLTASARRGHRRKRRGAHSLETPSITRRLGSLLGFTRVSA